MTGLVVALLLGASQQVAPDTTPAAAAQGPVTLAVRGPSPLLGAAAIIPVGAAQDPAGAGGTAWIYGRLLERELVRRLRFSASSVRVVVSRFEIVVVLLSPPDYATRDLRQFVEALEQETFDSASFAAVRSEVVRQLRFEEGAPVRTFEEERAELVYDGLWGGSLQGRLTEVEGLDLRTLSGWVAGIDRNRIAMAVVRPDAEPGTVAADAGPIAKVGVSGWAWSEARHERLERSITNAWVTVDAPIRSDLDPTTLDLLVHHLQELLSPSPPDPGIYSAEVEVLRTPLGPVLSVTAAVAPETAERWARQIEAAVRLEDLDSWVDERQFSWIRRRFRNTWLAREASPEGAALRIARDLAAGRPLRDPLRETGSLEAADLRTLAEAIGPPRVLVYGPVLGGS